MNPAPVQQPVVAPYPEFASGAALVIGGSGAIGESICRALAQAGSHVVVGYRANRAAADQVASEIRETGREASIAQANLPDPESIQEVVNEAIRRHGHLHSVVYAAGPQFPFQHIHKIPPSEWARVIDVDVNGCFNLVSAVLPHLRERKRGSIVALVTAALDRSPPRDILSAAPKAAIQMLIRGVAREEGRSGIRANCVGPGYIPAGLGLTTFQDDAKDFVERVMRAIPLRRAGHPDEVADVVCFLLSDKARYVTGETIAVAGGLQLA